MRLTFLGTPSLAVTPLQALVAAGHEIALVVTQPDARRGRGRHLSPSPVKAAAMSLGLPVTDDINDLAELADPVSLGVVVAYGRIIRRPILDRVPMVNLHFSLLPRWRGAAPMERALLAGDQETGVCLMEVAEGLDTGGIYRSATVPIGPTTTADELRNTLTSVGTALLIDALSEGLDSLGKPTPQTGEVSYAEKLRPEEFHIDWSQDPEVIDRLIRLGGAWTTHNGKRLKIHAARLNDERQLDVLIVQPEGKGQMPFKDWANGARWSHGDGFGT